MVPTVPLSEDAAPDEEEIGHDHRGTRVPGGDGLPGPVGEGGEAVRRTDGGEGRGAADPRPPGRAVRRRSRAGHQAAGAAERRLVARQVGRTHGNGAADGHGQHTAAEAGCLRHRCPRSGTADGPQRPHQRGLPRGRVFGRPVDRPDRTEGPRWSAPRHRIHGGALAADDQQSHPAHSGRGLACHDRIQLPGGSRRTPADACGLRAGAAEILRDRPGTRFQRRRRRRTERAERTTRRLPPAAVGRDGRKGRTRGIRQYHPAPQRGAEAARAAGEPDRRHPGAVRPLRHRHRSRLVGLPGLQRPVGGRGAAPLGRSEDRQRGPPPRRRRVAPAGEHGRAPAGLEGQRGRAHQPRARGPELAHPHRPGRPAEGRAVPRPRHGDARRGHPFGASGRGRSSSTTTPAPTPPHGTPTTRGWTPARAAKRCARR